ncbi:sulfite exporter TauE/SafE family protein [uncultured Rubinisphaera sp.]|uniref:sulfite exporter TauE/SafE family protein n=1 Tax=uncultured Rubinisphaera sp. TaxID=1678686 RepID=UPI0030DCFDC5
MESLIVLISGTATGIVAGLFGVGGSFLLVPLLSITTSIPMELIVGSCACQVLGPATAASLSFRQRRRDLRIPCILMGGIIAGTLWGSASLNQLKEQVGSNADSLTNIVQITYLVLLWSLGIFSLWESMLHKRGKPIPIGWARFKWLRPTCEVFGRNRRHQVSIISLSWFGVFVGFLSGFIGLSGGVIILPGLHYAYGIPTKRAARMSMLLVWLIAFQATIIHAIYQRVDLQTVMILLLGGTLGAKLGVQLSDRMSGGALRQHFAWLLLFTAAGLSIYSLLN